MQAIPWLTDHLHDLHTGLASLESQATVIQRWGTTLAEHLGEAGGRLLVAGNGGSAAEAQHLTAEVVGRFCGDRRPLSGICLSAETSSLTAVLNDYGAEEVFARQVEAHGRAGDVLLLLSTSGRSANLLAAAERGRDCGLRVWALTGRSPNPLADLATDRIAIDCGSVAGVQEVHLVAVHAVCAALDRALLPAPGATGATSRTRRSSVS